MRRSGSTTRGPGSPAGGQGRPSAWPNATPQRGIAAVEAVIPEARERRLPLELGRCLLALGTAQRKARQRREAAVSLDEAIDTFGRLGAARWRELAQAQRARAAPGQNEPFTPTERRITELVADGHSNREIAAALYISVKTVEATWVVSGQLIRRGRSWP